MRLSRVLAAVGAVGVMGCGGGDDQTCDAVVTINARTEDCQEQSERRRCSAYDADGGSCGLFGCVECTSAEPDD